MSSSVRVSARGRVGLLNERAGRVVGLSPVEGGILHISETRSGAMKVATMVRLVGGPPVSATGLAAALRALQRRHPVLSSVVGKRKGRRGPSAYFVREDAESEVPVEFLPRNGEDAWLQTWAEEAPLGPPLDRNPLKLFVYQGDGVAEILYVMDHFFSDGLSMVNFFKELLTLLAAYDAEGVAEHEDVDVDALVGPELAWQTSIDAATRASFPSRARQLLSAGWFLGRYVAFAPNYVDFPIRNNMPAKLMAGGNTCNPATLHIGRETSQALLRTCKAGGVTIGAALGAASVWALRDVIQAAGPGTGPRRGRDITVAFASDLRRRYAEPLANEHMGYHVSSMLKYRTKWKSARRAVVDEAVLMKTAREVRRHNEAHSFSSLSFATVLPSFFTQKPTHRFFSTIALTNWGRLDLDSEYGKWAVDSVVGVINNRHLRMPLLLCSSHGGQLTLTLCVSEPACSIKDAEIFLRMLQGHIETMAHVDVVDKASATVAVPQA